MKSGNLNFLEPSGPLQACNGTALPFHFVHLYNNFPNILINNILAYAANPLGLLPYLTVLHLPWLQLLCPLTPCFCNPLHLPATPNISFSSNTPI